MRLTSSSFHAALTLLLVTLTPPASSAAAGQAAPVAARVQAGQVALLGNALDPTTLPQLTTALASSEPIVRAVAARLAAVTNQTGLAEAIAARLVVEKDGYAAAEQVRALLLLRGAPALEFVMARLGPSGGRPVLPVAEWMVRNQPDLLADRLTALSTHLGDDLGRLSPFVRVAADRGGPAAEKLLITWLGLNTGHSWSAFLGRSADASTPAYVAMLRSASGASNADIREATVWYVVDLVSAARPVDASLVDAIAGQDASGPLAGQTPWETLGRDALRRRQGKPATDASAAVVTSADRHVDRVRALQRLGVLTAAETRVLRQALGDRFPKPPTTVPPPLEPNGAAMRTVPTMWPDFLGGLLEAAGCKVSDVPRYAASQVLYRADGRVERAQVGTGILGTACVAAAQAAFRLILSDVDYPHAPGVAEWNVLIVDKAFVACVDAPENWRGTPGQAGASGIDRPVKIRNVPPEYPTAQVREGTEGTVALEALITEAGCVSAIKVRHSAGPLPLDYSALQAVAKWGFTPTKLNGQPVSVTMTVTVNYALR